MPAPHPQPARWPRWVAALALAWAVLVGAGGCAMFVDTRGPDLKSAELIGTWTESKRGGTLTFLADGKFSTDDAVPLVLDCGFEPCLPPDLGDGKLAASGTWRIGPAFVDPNGPNDYVYVTIDRVDHPGVEQRVTGYNLRVERDDKGVLVLNPFHRFPGDNTPILYRKN